MAGRNVIARICPLSWNTRICTKAAVLWGYFHAFNSTCLLTQALSCIMSKSYTVLIYEWPAAHWVTFANDKGHTWHEVTTKTACRAQRLLGAWCCPRAGWLRISHWIIELRAPVSHQHLLSRPRYCGPAPEKPRRAVWVSAACWGLWSKTSSFCSYLEKPNSPHTQP